MKKKTPLAHKLCAFIGCLWIQDPSWGLEFNSNISMINYSKTTLLSMALHCSLPNKFLCWQLFWVILLLTVSRPTRDVQPCLPITCSSRGQQTSHSHGGRIESDCPIKPCHGIGILVTLFVNVNYNISKMLRLWSERPSTRAPLRLPLHLNEFLRSKGRIYLQNVVDKRWEFRQLMIPIKWRLHRDDPQPWY